MQEYYSRINNKTAGILDKAQFGSPHGQDVIFLRHLLRDLGFPESRPTPVKIDNSACVELGKHFESAKRVRHIDRRVNFLTDYQADGSILCEHISTHINTADFFTKPLPKDKFIRFRQAAMGLIVGATYLSKSARGIRGC